MPARLFIATLFLATATGCNREPSPASTKTAPATNAAPAQPPASDRRHDPAAALNTLFAGLSTGQGEALLSACPDRYARDLDRLLAQTLQPLDPAQRGRVATAIARFVDGLREREKFVLASQRIEIAGPAAALLRERFDLVCRFVAALARSNAWSAPQLGDSRQLLAAMGQAVAADAPLAAALRGAKFETVRITGDRATIRSAEAGGSGREFEVVLVDGVWVPATVAERWDAVFSKPPAEASAASNGPDLLSLATALDKVAADLARVTNQEEFDALADAAATRLLAVAAEAHSEPRALRPDEFVKIEIRGRLDAAAKDRLVWTLAAATDEPASGLADAVDLTDDAGIVVTVGPVADLSAFAQQLSVVKVEKVDLQTKTVTARATEP